jgi:cobalamin biosynthesis Mg chelatase CobN
LRITYSGKNCSRICHLPSKQLFRPYTQHNTSKHQHTSQSSTRQNINTSNTSTHIKHINTSKHQHSKASTDIKHINTHQTHQHIKHINTAKHQQTSNTATQSSNTSKLITSNALAHETHQRFKHIKYIKHIKAHQNTSKHIKTSQFPFVILGVIFISIVEVLRANHAEVVSVSRDSSFV